MTRVRLLGAPSPRMWDELIRSDPTAMVFQTPGWLRSLIRCGWSDGTRLYESDEGRSLVLPMAAPRYTPARAAIVASLPSGWGTGGLVASGGVHPDEVAAVARELARERFLQVRLRPSFLAAPVWEKAHLPGTPVRRSVHVLDLHGGIDYVWDQRFGAKARQAMRAARRRSDEAGVTIQCGHGPELVSQFYEVYLEWIARRARENGLPPWLARARAKYVEPLRTFEVVADELGERCRIRIASLNGRPVAAMTTLLGDRTAVYWRGYDDRHVARRLHLPELLQMAAIEDACAYGCVHYEMGESGGVESLERFKVKLGARPHPISEYRLERIALSTVQDRAAGAIRRLESVAARRPDPTAGAPTRS